MNWLHALFLVALTVVSPALVSAQPARSGATFNLGGTTSSVVGPMVAHDPLNNRWLQIAGNGFIEEHLLDASGGILRTFRVSTGTSGAESPALAFSPDLDNGNGGYLVIWKVFQVTDRLIRGRLIAADGTPLGDEFVVSTGHLGVRNVAYSPGSRVFLAVWTDDIAKRVYTQRIGTDGELLPSGGVAGPWVAAEDALNPDLAYSASTDRFYVVYARPATGYTSLGGALIDASSGDAEVLNSELGQYSGYAVLPSIAYNPIQRQYLVTWFSTGQAMAGQLVAEDGSPIELRHRQLAESAIAPHSVEFNPHSGEYLVAYAVGLGEIYGRTVRADGTADVFSFFPLTNYLDTPTSCDPRIRGLSVPQLAVSTTEKRWLVVAPFWCASAGSNGGFNAIYAQFVASTSVAQTPAGAAVLLDYTPGARLRGGSHTFRWVAGSQSAGYWINAGRAQGRYELFSNYVASQTSLTLRHLPVDGGPVWLRLMSRVNGAYTFTDHRFTAATARAAAVVSPAPGSALTGTTATFEWDAGEIVDGFWVNVGTAAGG